MRRIALVRAQQGANQESEYTSCFVEFHPGTVNIKGRYFQIIKDLSKENDRIFYYKENLERLDGLSPSSITEILKNYKFYNLEDSRVKLMIAIHYLTVNSQFHEMEKSDKEINKE